MLPTQSPMDAADELATIAQFGFKGALINGHTNGRYLDEEAFSLIFERHKRWMCLSIYIQPTRRRRSSIAITRTALR